VIVVSQDKPLRPRSFRFAPEDLAALELLQRMTGLTAIGAVRLAVREYLQTRNAEGWVTMRRVVLREIVARAAVWDWHPTSPLGATPNVRFRIPISHFREGKIHIPSLGVYATYEYDFGAND